MARSIDGLPDYLRARGFVVDGVPGWRSRRRPGAYAPRGIVAHHTGGGGNGIAYATKTLAAGFSKLPGPLCQINLERNGTVNFVAAGRSNHAGKVRKIAWMFAGDGNSQAIGIEANNTGTEGWSKVRADNPFGSQLAAYHALCAAIEDYFGWARGSVLGHGEVSTAGKWDPGVRDAQTGRGRMLDMDTFRSAVKAVRFGSIPKPPPVVVPVPEPVDPEVEAPEPVDFVKGALVNFQAASAALRKPGARKKWDARKEQCLDEAVATGADVIVGLECGGGAVLRYIVDGMAKRGYHLVPKGRGGRHIFVKKSTVTVERSGFLDPPRRAGNDKPAPWFIGYVNGGRALVVGGHLDPKDATGSWQVRQARAILNGGTALGVKYKVAKASHFYLMDTASNNRVRREVFEAAGFADVFDVARRTVNEQLKSYNAWKAPVRGPRVDLCAVYVGKGAGEGGEYARPIRVANQRLTKVFDHFIQVFISERQ